MWCVSCTLHYLYLIWWKKVHYHTHPITQPFLFTHNFISITSSFAFTLKSACIFLHANTGKQKCIPCPLWRKHYRIQTLRFFLLKALPHTFFFFVFHYSNLQCHHVLLPIHSFIRRLRNDNNNFNHHKMHHYRCPHLCTYILSRVINQNWNDAAGLDLQLPVI